MLLHLDALRARARVCSMDFAAAGQWESLLEAHTLTLIPTRDKRPFTKWADLELGSKLPPTEDSTGYACILRGSRLVVIDVDVKGGAPGWESLDQLQGDHDFPGTLTVETPSGGVHYYFTLPEDAPQYKDRIGVLPGLDLKAYGYVVIPGSDGYRVTEARQPSPAPQWLLDSLTRRPDRTAASAESPEDTTPRTPEDLATLAKGKRGPEWKFLRQCAQGLLPCRVAGGTAGEDLGAVDVLMWAALRALAAAWPDADAHQVVRDVFMPSQVTLEAQDANHGNPSYSLEDWEEKFSRALMEARATRQDTAAVDGLIPGAPPWSLYVHQGNGSIYLAHQDTGEIKVTGRPALSTLMRALGYPVSYTAQSGREVLLSPQELLHHHDALPATAVVRDLTATSTHQSPQGVLHVPAAPRPPVPPRHHPAIAKWLDLMIPDAQDRVAVFQWVGTLGHLETSQPALWFTGAAKSGKTLFARAVALLWGRPTATSGEDALGKFNQALAECPIVHFDEDFPRDWRGNPRIQDFKSLTDDYAHVLEQKYQPQEILNGSVRVVLTSNHFGLITHATDLQSDDVAALQRRIIHVEVTDAARGYLEGQDVQRWVRSGELAEHFRSIEESYRVAKKLPGSCPTIERKLRTDTVEAYPILLAISEWLRQADPAAHVDAWRGMGVYGDQVAVTSNAVARVLARLDTVARPPSRQRISAALASLGERHSVRTPSGPRWVYLLNMDHYMEWAEREDNGSEEIQELLGKWTP